MNLKKCLLVVSIFAAGMVILGGVFAIERPVLYHSEFLPVADAVTELAAESASSKLQRAMEQVERREAVIRRAGGRVKPQQVDDLRFWKQRVEELKRKLRRLDK